MTQPAFNFVVSLDGNASPVHNSYVVDIPGDSDFSEQELIDYTDENGVPISLILGTLEAMADMLSASDWSSDMLNAMADSLRDLGYEIKDLHED